MLIRKTTNKKNWININDFDEFNRYILSLKKFNNLKSLINVKFQINSLLKNTNEIQFTNLVYIIRKFLNDGPVASQWKYSYWFNRGYSKNESNIKVNNIQTENLKKRLTKLKKKFKNKKEINDELTKGLQHYLKTSTKDIFRKNSPRCIEYWIDKESSIEEAKEKHRKFNDHFSIEYYIYKYGFRNGFTLFYRMVIKRSKMNSGKNNPMYGKPSPQGSGNGWSGWYKGIFFRSILELSYIKYLIDNNIKFKNAEKKKYRVEYIDYKGNKRNYFPDFYLINSNEIIEIKPKKLIKSEINDIKFKAAKEKYGSKFKIITEDNIKKLNFNDIFKLIECGDLQFIKRYEEKFNESYKERKN